VTLIAFFSSNSSSILLISQRIPKLAFRRKIALFPNYYPTMTLIQSFQITYQHRKRSFVMLALFPTYPPTSTYILAYSKTQISIASSHLRISTLPAIERSYNILLHDEIATKVSLPALQLSSQQTHPPINQPIIMQMLHRALSGYDRLSLQPKCGFDMEELTWLFPEEM
jgi:hypothetical protein